MALGINVAERQLWRTPLNLVLYTLKAYCNHSKANILISKGLWVYFSLYFASIGAVDLFGGDDLQPQPAKFGYELLKTYNNYI